MRRRAENQGQFGHRKTGGGWRTFGLKAGTPGLDDVPFAGPHARRMPPLFDHKVAPPGSVLYDVQNTF